MPEQRPMIRFHSTKVMQTGPETVAFEGNFTIRGVTRREKLAFTIEGKGTRTPTVTGTMAFDRTQYGMNSGIPFIKVADRGRQRRPESRRKGAAKRGSHR